MRGDRADRDPEEFGQGEAENAPPRRKPPRRRAEEKK